MTRTFANFIGVNGKSSKWYSSKRAKSVLDHIQVNRLMREYNI